MRNSKKIMFFFIVLVIVIGGNGILLNKVWYTNYMTFKEVSGDSSKILYEYDKQYYIEHYTNFNSKEFSIELLYENISDQIKKNYDTLDKFKEYYNDKIGKNFNDEQYYSLMKSAGEESYNGSIKTKYIIYYYDLESYIEVLENENTENNKAKFSIEVYLIEKSIEDYCIEI